jgi:hypothetical protein
LDALYPPTRVFSDDEKQKTTNRMHPIHEGTNNEDVLIMTFQENVVIENYMKHTMSAMHENNYQEDVLPVTFKEDVLPVTFKEDVVIKNYQKCTMSTMHETTSQEDVDAKANMKNVVVPGDVANTCSTRDGSDDPQHNGMMGKMGMQDDTKRLAVTAITSEGGGGITKSACAVFSPRSLSHCFLQPVLPLPAHLTNNSRACHTLVIKL